MMMNEAETIQQSQTDTSAPKVKNQPQKVRRVGTFTMGICLVITGIVVCVGLFWPSENFIVLAKCAPLILVAVGIEVIYASVTVRDEKLKYDFLSMFVCFTLICGALAIACVSPLMEYYGPQRSEMQNTLRAQWDKDIYEQLKDNPDVNNVEIGIYFDDWRKAPDNITLGELNAGDYASVNVELKGQYKDKQAFLAACAPVIEAVKNTDVESPALYLHTQEDDKNDVYSLDIRGQYLLNRPVQELESEVDISVYNEDANYYMSEQELAQWEQQQAEDAREQAQRETEAQEEEARVQAEMEAEAQEEARERAQENNA